MVKEKHCLDYEILVVVCHYTVYIYKPFDFNFFAAITSLNAIYFLAATQCFDHSCQLQVNQVAVRSALLFHCSAVPKFKTKKNHCFVDEFLKISQ